MENILDYLKWRGDITFLESPLNEIDNAIFCAFSYIRIENFMKPNEVVSIKDLYPKYKNSDKKESILLKNQNKLFSLLNESKRFQNVKITKLVKESSETLEKQFCAMTFLVSDQELFIAFRGTDETLTGWKENFNLSFMNTTPSQERAVEYVNVIAKHTNKKITIGGHSKGGNLALYAYVFCDEETKQKIKQVYNNDGPGLKKDILDEQHLKVLEQNIITFLPASSIIGNLFENYSQVKIVKSSSIGILEHDLYTWKVLGNTFVSSKNLDEKTKELCNFLNRKINEIPDEKKKKIIDFLYEILDSFGIVDLEEVLNKIGKNTSLLKKHNISFEDMQIVWQILPLILEIIKKIF